MTRALKIYFFVLGVSAAQSMLAPSIVYVGLVAGILPGLLLLFAPSLFLYSVVWLAVFELMKALSRAFRIGKDKGLARIALGTIAIFPAAALGFLAPPLLNTHIAPAVAEARKADVEAKEKPVPLAPSVALVLPRKAIGFRLTDYANDLLCETLCQRLLYNGAAQRVIVAFSDAHPATAGGEQGRAFGIERREECPEPLLADKEIVWPGDIRAIRSVLGRVQARVAAGECLIHEPADVREAGLTISFREIKPEPSRFEGSWKLWKDTIGVNRLEIIQADGQVLFRRTEVKARPLYAPLLLVAESSFLTTVVYRGWERTETLYGDMDLYGRAVLPDLLGREAVRVPDDPSAGQRR